MFVFRSTRADQPSGITWYNKFRSLSFSYFILASRYLNDEKVWKSDSPVTG